MGIVAARPGSIICKKDKCEDDDGKPPGLGLGVKFLVANKGQRSQLVVVVEERQFEEKAVDGGV